MRFLVHGRKQKVRDASLFCSRPSCGRITYAPRQLGKPQSRHLHLCKPQNSICARENITTKLNMAANPLGYPAKPAFFLNTQIREGYLGELYRTRGSSAYNPNDPVFVAAIAARTQPVGGLAPFQVAPPPRSAAGRAQLARAIENRGERDHLPPAFWPGYQPRRPPFAERTLSQNIINGIITRLQLASNNIAFVKQLGWVSVAEVHSLST